MNFSKALFTTIFYILYLSSCGKTDGFAPSSDLSSEINPPSSAALDSLIITSPSILSAISNSDLIITGQCQSGTIVHIEGDYSESTICISSAFSFTVTKSFSGTYFFSLYQSNSYVNSPYVSVTWFYDINIPSPITISSPILNPFVSSDSTLNISGSCKTGNAVNITGDYTATTTCVADAFIFNGVSKTIDGTYTFNLTQTDLALNTTSTSLFTWIRDSSMPTTPTISNFTDNPHYTKTSPLTVTGACNPGNTIKIDENGVNLASTVCGGANSYTLNVSKGSPGTYNLVVYQTDSVNFNISANRDFIWIFDNNPPANVTINSPTTSPITSSGSLLLTGTCESYATVNLTGDDIQNQVCNDEHYGFEINEATSGTYNYSLTQTDLALNTSTATSQQWINEPSTLPTPTINTPPTSTFSSNSTNLILSGQCQNDLTVQLSGVLAADVVLPLNSLTTKCVGSTYSFTIFKTDGTYALSIYQTNGVINSDTVSRTWTKDTIEPNTTISTYPPNPNYSNISNFTFTANESGTFECNLDGAIYTTCISPLSFSNLSNGSHTLTVRSIDLAGNVESLQAVYTWTQDAHQTLALFHFDSAVPMQDSSNYTGANNNTLTDNSSVNLASAKFAEGRTVFGSNHAFVADSPSQQIISDFLTLDAQIILTSLPLVNTILPIVSKINGAQASFEYGIKKVSANYYIYFKGSLDGATSVEKKSIAFTAGDITALTSGFNHVAVTWELGLIKFYLNGVSMGAATLGTVGFAKLANSATSMRIGYNGTQSLGGSVDEVRVSQIVRWHTSFTPPASPHTTD